MERARVEKISALRKVASFRSIALELIELHQILSRQPDSRNHVEDGTRLVRHGMFRAEGLLAPTQGAASQNTPAIKAATQSQATANPVLLVELG